jgi:hypothetical protein
MRGGEYTSTQPNSDGLSIHHFSSLPCVTEPSTSRPLRLVPIRVLQECAQDLAARLSRRRNQSFDRRERVSRSAHLEQRMASHDTEEALEAFPSGLDDLI